MRATFSAAAVYGAFALFFLASPGMAHTLENSQVRVRFDDRGGMTELVDKRSDATRNLISKPRAGVWKLIFQKGMSLENVINPDGQDTRVEPFGPGLRIVASKLRFCKEILNIGLEIQVRLDGDEIRWSATIDNRSDVTVSEFFFPQIGGVDRLDSTGRDDLLWPSGSGIRIRNVKGTMRARVDALSPVEQPVNGVADQRIEAPYPGGATMSWYEFTNGRRGIYFASYDPEFLGGMLRVARKFSEGGSLVFEFVKFPYVRPGETWRSAEYVTRPHPGDWHESAQRYRAWANSWFQQPARPEWVKQFKGMLLVILRQQYGDVMWHYDDIPWLYEEAKKSGVDTVALFGWTEAGHDNQYPIYKPDPAMGGEPALRKALAEVSRRGGHTLLYLQGHLMDATTDWYKDRGHAFAATNMWGSPYFEQWNKGYESSLLRQYTHKLFATVCTLDDEWSDLMVKEGKEKLGYGATALIYDQCGGSSYLCYNVPQVKPSQAFVMSRVKLLRTLREKLKPVAPNFGFMVEYNTDVYAQWVDFIHGAGQGNFLSDVSYPALFRYTFPEIIMTARQQAVRLDARHVNYTFTYGFRYEMESRYRADMETLRGGDAAELSEYMRQTSALRDRYWDILGNGRFLDDQGLKNGNPAITAALYEGGGRHAATVWNDTKSPQSLDVSLPGKQLKEAAGIRGVYPQVPRMLAPQEVAVLVFE